MGGGLRIGLVSVYFGLFDASMPPSFRQDREAYAAAMRDRLSREGDVVYPGVVDSEESGRAAGEAFRAADLDLIVFAPTMAAPPSYGWLAIEGMDDTPLIVVAGQESSSIPDDYATTEATRRSLPVGLVMFTNVLVRRDRSFLSVIGAFGAPAFDAELSDVVAGVRAAVSVRGSTFAAVGPPIGGYWDVEATPEALASLGVNLVDIDAAELNEAFATAAADEIERVVTGASERFDATGVAGDVLQRSARLTAAMRELCARHGVAGGTINCHGDLFRFNPEVGITGCLALTTLAEDGLSFACTGDLPAGIALTLGKAVSGAALYCELYQLDLDGDWLLVANGGEGDPASADDAATPILLPEDHYLGEHGAGTAIAFPLPQGPATVVSLSPVPAAVGGWALVVAEGEILGSKHEGMEGPNGMFRFSSGPVAEGYRRWCEAGATHHAGVLPGHRRRALEAAVGVLGIELRGV